MGNRATKITQPINRLDLTFEDSGRWGEKRKEEEKTRKNVRVGRLMTIPALVLLKFMTVTPKCFFFHPHISVAVVKQGTFWKKTPSRKELGWGDL